MERLRKIRNIIIHIAFLAALFVGSTALFGRMMNRVTPDVAETMTVSTFPLVYMNRDGVNFNCLHGYAKEMDPSYIRDSLTPLSPERELGISIEPFSSSIDSVSYEVTTLDGTETLENTKVVKLEQDNNYLNASLTLQNKMRMNQEYMLKIAVSAGGRDIYYYTHVVLADGLHTLDYLNYVNGFYDKCVNKTDRDSIGEALEPDATTDVDATLAFMDIHDSVAQLTWASLNPQIYYKPTPTLKEINTNTATLTMEYRIAALNAAGATEIYNVNEYYRVRYTDSRVFLLNFERTTDEVFDPENEAVTDQGIRLGITDKDVEFTSDSRNQVLAFVQEDELWTYEIRASKLTQVFSFPQKENMDIRDFYGKNRIRILRVDTDGNVWFAVAGYMNRGSHEGENGVAVYYYESATAMVDEKIFLASMESQELLFRDVETLAYISEDQSKFTVFLEGSVYRVDLNSRTYETIVVDVMENCYAGSETGRYFGWLKEGSEYDSSTLCVLDAETGAQREIICAANERIRPVAFIRDDLVYGLAQTGDISAEHGGNGIFPMYRLVIEDGEGNAIKNYQPSGYYVTGVSQADNMLTLERVVKNGTTFQEGTEDHIVNTDTGSDVSIGIATRTTERKQTEVLLRIGTTVADRNPQVVRSKIITYASSRTLEIPANRGRQERYYVYASGRLDSVCANANEAIVRADEKVGVVVDNAQNYVWVRGDRKTTADIDLTRLPAALTTGSMDPEELQEALGLKVVDLSGCTLDQVLYFVSRGRAVIALSPQGPKTIVGYDEFNTHLLDPGGTEWYYAGLNDSTEMFEQMGNLFISYLEEAP